MFLFKCCANHSSDTRRSSLSHIGEKKPLQVLIKTTISNTENHEEDNTGDVLLSGGKQTETDIEEKEIEIEKEVNLYSLAFSSFDTESDLTNTNKPNVVNGNENKAKNIVVIKQSEKVDKSKNSREEKAKKFIQDLRKSIKDATTSPKKGLKNKCASLDGRFSISDKSIHKNYHHNPIQGRNTYNNYNVNPRISNSCMALLTGDFKVVTSLVKNTNDIFPDKIPDKIPGNTTERGCGITDSTKKTGYDDNIRRGSSQHLLIPSVENVQSPTSDRSEKYHETIDDELSFLKHNFFTLAIDNYTEILRKNSKVVKFLDYTELSSVLTENSPKIPSLTSSAIEQLPLFPSLYNEESANDDDFSPKIKHNIDFSKISEDFLTDENKIYSSSSKPYDIIIDTDIAAKSKYSNPSNNYYYSSNDSDMWVSTTASSDYATTSTITTTTTHSGVDDHRSICSKTSELSSRSISSDLFCEEEVDHGCSNDGKTEEYNDSPDYSRLDNTFEFLNRDNYKKFMGKFSSDFVKKEDDTNLTPPDISTLTDIQNLEFSPNSGINDNLSINNSKEHFDIINIPNQHLNSRDEGSEQINESDASIENINNFTRKTKIQKSDLPDDFHQGQRNLKIFDFLLDDGTATYLESYRQTDNINDTEVVFSSEMEKEKLKEGVDDAEKKIIFKCFDDENEKENEEEENENGNTETNSERDYVMNIQPVTRELESYFISEPSKDQTIVTVSSPDSNFRDISLYCDTFCNDKNENRQLMKNQKENPECSTSVNPCLADINKQKSVQESSDEFSPNNDSTFDFKRFYSKSTPNLTSEVDRKVSSLTLIEEYFSKYIIDCETQGGDENSAGTERTDENVSGESNVDPRLSPDSNSQDLPTEAGASRVESENCNKHSNQKESIDKFTEICKKFSSTCLNIFQTSYPALHTTSNSCPAISELKLDLKEPDSIADSKSQSQSSATLSALYAAIFPTYDSSEMQESTQESPPNKYLIKETSVDDCALIGKPELTNKKPSLVRRCLSLKAPENVPATEIRKKKKVKFADAFGLELAIVRMILSGENLSDQDFQQRLQAASVASCQNTCATPQNGNNFGSKQSTSRSSCLRQSNNSCKNATEKGIKRIVADFIQPGNSEDFSSKLWLQNVVLESCLPEKTSNSISGCIRVNNLTYGKQVILRYTVNNWISFDEHNASFIYGSNDGSTDRFSFMVHLPPYFDVGNVFEFAILFRTEDGREFWDNNHGLNYRMICCYG